MIEPSIYPSTTLLKPTMVNNAPWEVYRRPFVRDLAYALACPNVLTGWLDLVSHRNNPIITVHSPNFWQTQYAAYSARLKELDTTTAYQDLSRYLLRRPSPHRLGFHFEGLLAFWLTDGYAHGLHTYQILASNVQLFYDKQTIGELDLILYNHQDQLTEHWELAIKFFMGSMPFAPLNWVGINSNDNLQRKMTHMQTKQFGSVSVATAEHGQVKIDKRYAVIKGRFFLPQSCVAFQRPSWLESSFPLHQWYDGHDKVNLATIDSSALRQAHYVEWFTKRGFYDEPQAPIAWLQNAAPVTGLYFEGDRPLVIYPARRDTDTSNL
jgi:hypothetical protein